MAKPFRTPKEMHRKESKVPVSVRIKTSTKEALEQAAEGGKLKLAQLIANVLDDYTEWLSKKN